jgi:hypothetical protein
MITRNYSIFYLFSFFLSSLTYGEESKEAPFYDRKDLVGHFALLGETSAFGLFKANAQVRKAALFQQAFKCKAAQ